MQTTTSHSVSLPGMWAAVRCTKTNAGSEHKPLPWRKRKPTCQMYNSWCIWACWDIWLTTNCWWGSVPSYLHPRAPVFSSAFTFSLLKFDLSFKAQMAHCPINKCFSVTKPELISLWSSEDFLSALQHLSHLPCYISHHILMLFARLTL